MSTGDCGDYKWAIGGLCTVVVALAAYITKLHLEIGKGKDDRIADLKDQFKKVKKEE